MRFWFGMGCVMAGLGVAAGAFGAHALKQRLPEDLLSVFETAVRYQMYHAFGLLAVAFAVDRCPQGNFQPAGWLLIVGIVLFSGSLYALCLTGSRLLGIVTPFGGICFLAAWVWLAWEIWSCST